MRSEIVNKNLHTRSELLNMPQQTNHKPAAVRQPEKVSGMNPDSAVEQIKNGFFVCADRWNSQYCIPTSFNFESANNVKCSELMIEFLKVRLHPFQDLSLNMISPCEP